MCWQSQSNHSEQFLHKETLDQGDNGIKEMFWFYVFLKSDLKFQVLSFNSSKNLLTVSPKMNWRKTKSCLNAQSVHIRNSWLIPWLTSFSLLSLTDPRPAWLGGRVFTLHPGLNLSQYHSSTITDYSSKSMVFGVKSHGFKYQLHQSPALGAETNSLTSPILDPILSLFTSVG